MAMRTALLAAVKGAGAATALGTEPYKINPWA